MNHFRVARVCRFLLLVVLPISSYACAENADNEAAALPDCEQTIQTPAGAISGIPGRVDGVCRYLGIRYGKAPVGDLRFRPPVAEPAWSGVFKADTQGSDCLQKLDLQQDQLSLDPPVFGEEDCLFLNVYTPGEPARLHDLPVMVFIHGGAFVIGGSSWDLYEGSKLAAEGVVVVTINYRLGPLGFFATPELRDEDPEAGYGNQGFQDQRLALAWVQKNIASFGGDPGNVTIFGESAGGMSVCSHLASPLSRGLFHKAIIESGGCKAITDPERAFAHAATWTEQAGCAGAPEGELACLRRKSGESLMRTWQFDTISDGLEPTLDGVNFSETPLDTIRAGKQAPVPLLSGSNADEVRVTSLIQVPILTLRDMAWSTYYDLLRQVYPADLAAQLPRLYGESRYDNPYDAWSDLQSDWMLTCPSQIAVRDHVESGHTGWHYRFRWALSGDLGREIGAHHGMELFFVFGNLDGYAGLVGRTHMLPARELSRKVRRTWVAFARTGDPNTEAWNGWHNAADGTWEMAIDGGWLGPFKQDQCDLLDPYLPTGLDRMVRPTFRFAGLLQ